MNLEAKDLGLDSYWAAKQAQRERRANRDATVGLGVEAPDFDLPLLGTEDTIRLSSLRGRMVLLFFGSYTCPITGSVIPGFNDLYQDFKDEVEFLFVYTREAHPIGGGRPPWKAPVKQHENMDERAEAAAIFAREAQVSMRIAVDNMTDDTSAIYTGSGVGCLLLDQDGKVLYQNKSHRRVKAASVRKRLVERLSGAA